MENEAITPKTTIEKDMNKEFENIIITEFGSMGYTAAPDSAISLEKKLSPEKPKQVHELYARMGELVRNPMEHGLLVQTTRLDDGCIDGRTTGKIVALNDGVQVKSEVVNEGERPKLAGGGYVTGVASRIAEGERGASLDDDFETIGAELATAETPILCGAHTADHAHGGTGCGANDKFTDILKNTVAFADKVKETTQALLEHAGLSFKEETFSNVITNWNDAVNDEAYVGESTGFTRLDKVLEAQAKAAKEGKQADTKELTGEHNESFIVINYVKGTTFSQAALRALLKEEFPDLAEADYPQVFVVDAWRVVEVATAAAGEGASDPDKEAAIYGGVAFQVGTALTLTDGTLDIVAYK